MKSSSRKRRRIPGGRRPRTRRFDRSSERYKDLIHTIDSIVWEAEPFEPFFTFVSNQAERILGYPVMDWYRENFWEDHLYSDDRTAARRVHTENVDAKKDHAFEYRMVHALGHLVWIRDIVHVVVKKGKVVRIRGFMVDITQQKAMEAAIRETENKFRSIVEQSLVGVYIIQNNRFLYVNPRFSEIFGYTQDEIMGTMSPVDLCGQDFDDRMGRLLRGDVERMADPFRSRRKNGLEVDFEVYGSRTMYSGRPAVIGTLIDVTDRIQAIDELQESHNFNEEVIRHAEEGIVVYDRNLNYLLWNNFMERMTGLTRDEVLNKNAIELFPHLREQGIDQYLRRALAGETCQSPDFEYRIASTGRSGLAIGRYSPYRNVRGDIIGVIGVITDITQRRKMEEELLRARKIESVGLLAGGIAHDFNNILTVILGNISLSRLKAAERQDLQDALLQAEKAALRAKDLTQQLLTFSRGGRPVKKNSDVKKLIRETAEFSSMGSVCRCRVDIADDLYDAMIDEGQISQVLQNLLFNAQQAMPEGGDIVIAASNRTIPYSRTSFGLTVEPGEYLCIEVRDTGSGIDPSYIDKIFDPYFTTKEGGNGLGLATAYSIVRHHQGLIELTSRVGQGTTFFIFLPAHSVKSDRADPVRPMTPTMRGRILVMDDEPLVRDLAQSMLVSMGFEVETVESGREAIARYERHFREGHPFSAVIMDLTIPSGMGGKEAAQRLRRLDPNARLIVSSGYSHDPIMADYADFGFSAVLPKPYTVEELSRVLAEIQNPT